MVAESLLNQGYDVFCVEPNIDEHEKYDLITFKEAISEFTVLALLVNHKEFISKEASAQLKDKGVLNFCGNFLL